MTMDNYEGCESDNYDWYFGVPFPSKRKAAAVQERELKVGDRVRVTKLGTLYGGSNHGADVGDVFKVLSVESNKAVFTGEWYLWEGEFELLPPTFPPNTRVRVIRNTNRYAVGDTGTVTVSSDESVGVRMDDGRYWSFKPEDLVVVPQDGSVTAEKLSVASLSTPAPDCAGRNGEQGEWTVTTDHNGFVTGLHVCDQRRPANDPAAPCIVMRLDDGQPRPSYCPYIHTDAATATKEAERLARANPGKQFDVYQRVTGRVAEQHVEMKEVA